MCPYILRKERIDVAQTKMNKREFIGYIAKRQGVTKVIASKMYDAVIDGITSAVIEENVRLSLMGFGSFELKTHRGHPVRFCDNAVSVDSYQVLRFTPSTALNRELRGVKAGLELPEPEVSESSEPQAVDV